MNTNIIKIIGQILGGAILGIVGLLYATPILNKTNSQKNSDNFLEITTKIIEFTENSGLSDFYQFVENLSLLEHLVLLDILLFFLVMITIINIFSALFGNEVIKYFNLENKYPKLLLFFKIRLTLQKYYLIWSALILMFVCIFAIIINTVSLYLTLT